MVRVGEDLWLLDEKKLRPPQVSLNVNHSRWMKFQLTTSHRQLNVMKEGKAPPWHAIKSEINIKHRKIEASLES